MKILIRILIFVSLFAANADLVSAQDKPSVVRVKNADKFIFENLDDNQSVQYLKGNVKMEHDSSFMYSDSAVIRDILLNAIGDIIIIQRDSTHVFADSLSYNSESYNAELFGGVILENNEEQLFTEKLLYNTNTKIATYQDTAILLNSRSKLSSVEGIYKIKEKMAHFKNNVVVKDSSFTLYTDSLDFNTSIQKAIFKGPTFIYNKEREIYCEDGYYLIDEGKAYFATNAYVIEGDKLSRANEMIYSEKDSLLILMGNAIYTAPNEFAKANKIRFDDLKDELELLGDALYQKDSSTIIGPHIKYNTKSEELILERRSELNQPNKNLVADSINYNELDKKGHARGDLIFIDSTENTILYADELFYEENSSNFLSFGDTINPMILKINDKDSIYFSADTLISREEEVDSLNSKSLYAFNDVKIWKSDLRGIADSLYYSSIDSTYKLFGQPIIWTDSSEYKGDTIFIKMQNDEIRSIEAIKHGYIINMHNDRIYDQIKGKRIISYFDSSELKTMDVLGSAESIYFLKDSEEAYIGPNHTKCSKITFYFEDDDIKDVKFYDLPESTLTPMQQAKEEQLFLKEFKWQFNWRPVDSESIRIKTNRKIKSTDINLQKTSKPDLEENPKDPFSDKVKKLIDEKKD